MEYDVVEIDYAVAFSIIEVALVTEGLMNKGHSLRQVGDHELQVLPSHGLRVLESADKVVEAGEQLPLVLVNFL